VWQAAAALRRIYNQALQSGIVTPDEIWATVDMMNRWEGIQISRLAFDTEVGHACQQLNYIPFAAGVGSKIEFVNGLKNSLPTGKIESSSCNPQAPNGEISCWGVSTDQLRIGKVRKGFPTVARLTCLKATGSDSYEWIKANNTDPFPDSVLSDPNKYGTSYYGNPRWYDLPGFKP